MRFIGAWLLVCAFCPAASWAAFKNAAQDPTSPSVSATASLQDRLLSLDSDVQTAALTEFHALDGSAKEKLVSFLTPELSGDGPFVQSCSTEGFKVRFQIYTLGLIGPEAASSLPAIVKSLKDPELADAGIPALVKVSPTGKDVASRLAGVLKDRAAPLKIKRIAIQSLGTLGSAASPAVPLLSELALQSGAEPESLQAEASRALEILGVEPAQDIPTLVKGLDNSKESVRQQAMTTLARKGPAAISALLQALEQGNRVIRQEAMEALTHIYPQTPEMVSAFIKALRDKNRRVRRLAVESLQRMGSLQATEALESYREDERKKDQKRAHVLAGDYGRLHTLGEALAPLPPDADNESSSSLAFQLRIPSAPQEILVTVHRGEDRPDLLRLWLKDGPGYHFAQGVAAPEDETFEAPKGFRYKGNVFLQISDKIFAIMPDGTLQVVMREPASARLLSQLSATERIKGKVIDTFSNDQLRFSAIILKEGDLECCPTGGEVAGVYQIIGDKRYDPEGRKWLAAFRMVPGQYARRALRAANVNQINGFTVLEETPKSLVLKVDYFYSGDQTRTDLYMGGLPLRQGRTNAFWGYTPTPISRGRGSATLKISVTDGVAPGSYESDELDLNLFIAGASQFYRRTFPYKKKWRK